MEMTELKKEELQKSEEVEEEREGGEREQRQQGGVKAEVRDKAFRKQKASQLRTLAHFHKGLLRSPLEYNTSQPVLHGYTSNAELANKSASSFISQDTSQK